MEHAKDYGLSAQGSASMPAAVVQALARRVAARSSSGVGFLLKKNKVEVDLGRGHDHGARQGQPVQGKPQIRAEGRAGRGDYSAKHIIVATGARRARCPGIEPDRKLIWTYFEAMVPTTMPKSLLVVGSGAIGIEFASFYRTMGVDVTVVEVLPQILPVEDAEIAALARKRFEKQGIKILHRRQGRRRWRRARLRHRHHRRRQGRHADDHRRAR